MPLTCNKKFGVDYLYQPYFTQQLGVFSSDVLRPSETDEFLKAIPDRYRYISIQLNDGNSPFNADFQYKARKNFTLDLSYSYIQLSINYHRNCRRNIQKALNSRLTVKHGPGPAAFTRFVSRHLERKHENIRKNLFPLLQKICSISLEKGTGEILGVYKPGDNLLAAGWFVTVAGRFLFLVCASTPVGKKNHAMYFLVDHVIREKAGTNLILDFTGSDLPGVAYFNTGFGAVKNTYLAIKRNLLPWPLRWLER